MKVVKMLAIVLIAGLALTGAARASKIEVDTQYDFKLALDYVFTARVDTIVLVTSGGIYTTADTMHLQIKRPLVIMAKPGLAQKPVFRHGDLDSSVIEIFRIHDDVTFDGIIFDGYNGKRPMKYGLRVGHGPATQIPRIYTREGVDITIKNCEFRDFFPPNWQNDSGGNAFYFLAPAAGEPVIKAGTVRIENCTFRNLGDEAIRIAETEKYKVTRALDTLIVRNCTFKNIFAECIRLYADTDTSTADAYVLVEHLTVDSSGTRMAYFKNNKNVIFRDILVTNSHLPKLYRAERADYVVQVQLPGSFISNIDTLNLLFTVPYSSRISATKGGKIDASTIYAFDPLYQNSPANNYTLAAASPAYGIAHDGQTLGDLRWATQTPTRVPFLLTIAGKGKVLCDPPLIAPNYLPGTVVTLTAVPDSGWWRFTGWSGAVTGTDNQATVTVNGPTSIGAEFTEITAVDLTPVQPAEYALGQNYPNPFNAETTFSFSLEREGLATLEIYNMLGQKVLTLLEKKLPAGSHTLRFDAIDLPTGLYLYRFHSGSFQATRKFILLK
jgi:hypothetical protein